MGRFRLLRGSSSEHVVGQPCLGWAPKVPVPSGQAPDRLQVRVDRSQGGPRSQWSGSNDLLLEFTGPRRSAPETWELPGNWFLDPGN